MIPLRTQVAGIAARGHGDAVEPRAGSSQPPSRRRTDSARALGPIGRPMTARKPDPHQQASESHGEAVLCPLGADDVHTYARGQGVAGATALGHTPEVNESEGSGSPHWGANSVSLEGRRANAGLLLFHRAIRRLHKRIDTRDVMLFCKKHKVSFDWLLCSDLRGPQRMTREAKAAPPQEMPEAQRKQVMALFSALHPRMQAVALGCMRELLARGHL